MWNSSSLFLDLNEFITPSTGSGFKYYRICAIGIGGDN